MIRAVLVYFFIYAGSKILEIWTSNRGGNSPVKE
jgi:hypothetical protein